MHIEDFIKFGNQELPEDFMLRSRHRQGFMFTVILPDKSAVELFIPEELFESKSDKEVIEWFLERVRRRWLIEVM